MDSFDNVDWRSIDFPGYVPDSVKKYIQQIILSIPTISDGVSAIDCNSLIYKVAIKNDEFDLQELYKQLQIPKHIPKEIHQFFLDCIAECCVVIAAKSATYRKFHERIRSQEKLNEQELSFQKALEQDMQQQKDSLLHYLLYLVYECDHRIWTRILGSIQELKAQVLPKLKQCSPKDFGISVPAVSNTQDEYYQENFPTVEKMTEHIDQLFSYYFFLAALQTFEVIHEDICKLDIPKKIYQSFRCDIQGFENSMLIRHFIEQVKLVFNTTRFHPRQWYERNIFSILYDKQNAFTKQLFCQVIANMTDLLIKVVCLQMERSHFRVNQIIKADDIRRVLETDENISNNLSFYIAREVCLT